MTLYFSHSRNHSKRFLQECYRKTSVHFGKVFHETKCHYFPLKLPTWFHHYSSWFSLYLRWSDYSHFIHPRVPHWPKGKVVGALYPLESYSRWLYLNQMLAALKGNLRLRYSILKIIESQNEFICRIFFWFPTNPTRPKIKQIPSIPHFTNRFLVLRLLKGLIDCWQPKMTLVWHFLGERNMEGITKKAPTYLFSTQLEEEGLGECHFSKLCSAAHSSRLPPRWHNLV